MAEWGTVRLGDVADMLTGYPFKSDQYTSDKSGIRLIRGDNIVQGSLRWDGVKRWPASQATAFAAYELAPNDVVLAMDRPWIEAGLKYATIRENDCPALLVQRVTRLRKTDRLDGRYLSYVIGSSAFTQHVLAVQTGTAVPHISGGQIKAFEFALPAMDTQLAVASILSALDDKIELNRRMNETLEEGAQALFRDWFVDFGPTRAKAEGRPAYLAPDLWSLFPDRLGDDGVPEGWKWESLIDQAHWVNGAAYKNMDFVDRREGLPVVKIAELKAGVTGQTKFTNTDLGARYRIDDGELLFSWSGNPDTSIDAFVWTGGAAWLNQHIFAVRENGKRAKADLFVLLKWLMPEFAEMARNKQTTGLGHVTKDDMRRLQVVVASRAVREAFSKCVVPIFDQILLNITESRSLSATRDALLPKLMSGEIKVRDAEALAA